MKKIIPFTKDIKFNTNIYEVTSISLEHNLSMVESNMITGEFIISGEYKMSDSSLNTEPFIHGLPFDIALDAKYDSENIKIDIDDFKFEIINEEILRINIDVLIEGVKLIEFEEEMPIIDEIKPDLVIEARAEEESLDEDRINLIKDIFDKKEDDIMNTSEDLFLQVDEDIKQVNSSNDEVDKVMSIFNNFSDKDEKYVSYHVHIVRDNDNIDFISTKYGVSIEELKQYNDIEKITLGDKIIIPYTNNEKI